MGTDFRLILPNRRVVYETSRGRGFALAKLAVKPPPPALFGVFDSSEYRVCRFTAVPTVEAYMETLDVGLCEEESPFHVVEAVRQALTDPDHVLARDDLDLKLYSYPTAGWGTTPPSSPSEMLRRARARANLGKPYPYVADGWTVYPNILKPDHLSTD